MFFSLCIDSSPLLSMSMSLLALLRFLSFCCFLSDATGPHELDFGLLPTLATVLEVPAIHAVEALRVQSGVRKATSAGCTLGPGLRFLNLLLAGLNCHGFARMSTLKLFAEVPVLLIYPPPEVAS
jgi:hypothetical protein